MDKNDSLVCDLCKKQFGRLATKNRHLRTIHKKEVEGHRKSLHIKCPVCSNKGKETLPNHDSLIAHLSEVHQVTIKQSDLNFRSMEEFTEWKSKENREGHYSYRRSIKRSNEQYLYFNCNRSNSRGYESNCTKRTMKAGGSIKIIGVCPSRICAKISENGVVNVKFIETHIGHENELRTQRLLKREQKIIVEQLQAGVSNDIILQNAKKIQNGQLQRINLITRTDLRYLARRFNIEKKRHTEDMKATTVKVEECNQESENQAFLFKKIGKKEGSEKEEEDCTEDNLFMQKPSTSKTRYHIDLTDYLKEEQKDTDVISFDKMREIELEEFNNYAKSLDKESYNKLMENIRDIINRQKTNQISKKIKIENQIHYPSKK